MCGYARNLKGCEINKGFRVFQRSYWNNAARNRTNQNTDTRARVLKLENTDTVCSTDMYA